ncbi:hypothetical protein AB0L75_27960 [Streptomyces sp. NPDC052101]|uniref:hypothetical protein n=1 Tax=Streptomyces sp. NPDC052101 TaxID=3155763 RepID=UPI0034127B11
MTYLISLGTVQIDLVYVIGAGAVLALLLIGWLNRRGRSRASAGSGTVAVVVSAIAAIICTVYSCGTSWVFAADYLDISGTAERAVMFAAAEIALFAAALMARQNLSTQGAPGVPGSLVWLITGVQVIPAYAESGPVGGTVRAFAGPFLAAVLWHLAMGVELRMRKPGATSQGVVATLGRELLERLLSRLGLATRNRDAAQITRDRATTRAAALASRVARMSPDKLGQRRGQRIVRRLESALARSGVGSDPEQRRALLEQLAARRQAIALARVDLPSLWDHDAYRGTPSPRTPPPASHEAIGDRAETHWLHTVPNDGPPAFTSPIGDRPAGERARPETGTEPGGDRPHPVPGNTGDRDTAGDHPGEEGSTSLVGGTEKSSNGDRDLTVPGTVKTDDAGGTLTARARETAGQGATRPSPTPVPLGDRDRGDQEREGSGTGTDPVGDRPHPVPDTSGDRDTAEDHSDTKTGTSSDGDRPRTVPNDGPHGDASPIGDRPDGDRAGPGTGTEPGGDRPHTVPVRRKPKPKGPRNRPRGGQPKRSRKQPQLSVEEMVERVRPHVPALLERDGNESLTRVQLREILRVQELGGGRNERLTSVLQKLRDEPGTTTTRSTTR